MEFDSAALHRALAAAVADIGQRNLCVAFSGGLDSTALLHAARNLQHWQRRLRAIHIHHGILPDADLWSREAQAACAESGIDCAVIPVEVRQGSGESLEEQARVARYSALEAHIDDGEVLLTAQHGDDQLETVLLQLFRGAGVAGLAAMPVSRPFGGGLHVRPLLGFGRADLLRYATAHGLRWLHDPSNEDQRFDRNYLRNTIIPYIRQRWPGVAPASVRSAANCAEALRLLEELAELDLATAGSGGELSVAALRRLSRPRQRNLLRRWIAGNDARMPSAARLNSIIDDVVGAAEGGAALVRWGQTEVRRFDDRLLLGPLLPPLDATAKVPWPDPVAGLELGGAQGRLRCAVAAHGGLDSRHLFSGRVEVGYRAGGERLRISGKAHSTGLSRLFQEARIFPWMRDRVPLVFIDGELAAVADLWVAEAFAAAPGARATALEWLDHPLIR